MKKTMQIRVILGLLAVTTSAWAQTPLEGPVVDGNLEVLGRLTAFELNVEFAGPAALDQESTQVPSAFYHPDMWQSFTPSVVGQLAKIEVRLWPQIHESVPGRIRIYAGQGTDGKLLMEEPVTLIYDNGDNWYAYPLPNGPVLSAEELYTMRFNSEGTDLQWQGSTENPYPRGRSSEANPDVDFAFKTFMAESTCCGLTTELNGDVRINDFDLRLRGGSDDYHGLGWYGRQKLFANTNVDGPVAYGYNGGALGSTVTGEKIALRWNANGNVGIGTTSPTVALTVQRQPGTGLVARFQDNSTPNSALDIRATLRQGQIQAAADGDPGTLALNPDGGKVGIGTTAPQAKLHVFGNAAVLALEGINHSFISWYPHGYSAGRKGWMGWQEENDPNLTIMNEIPDADILLRPSGTGNVGIGTMTPNFPLEMASGAHVTTGGTWTNASSRAKKENFQATATRDVLQRVLSLPISSWNYKIEDDGVRHIGPMAEDFFDAFGLGHADDSISTVDSDGVALAAIQGLHDLMLEKDERIAGQQSRIANLEERLQRIEALISHK